MSTMKLFSIRQFLSLVKNSVTSLLTACMIRFTFNYSCLPPPSLFLLFSLCWKKNLNDNFDRTKEKTNMQNHQFNKRWSMTVKSMRMNRFTSQRVADARAVGNRWYLFYYLWYLLWKIDAYRCILFSDCFLFFDMAPHFSALKASETKERRAEERERERK